MWSGVINGSASHGVEAVKRPRKLMDKLSGFYPDLGGPNPPEGEMKSSCDMYNRCYVLRKSAIS